MATPLLTLQDIERWVPDATFEGGVGIGLVAKTFLSVTRVLTLLKTILVREHDSKKSEASRPCQNEIERFVLWGQGLGVAEGRLDEVLPHSKKLHHEVLSLLLRLGSAVLQGISTITEKSQHGDCEYLATLLEAVESVLRESDPEQYDRPDTPSGSDTSDYQLEDYMEEFTIYIDCLLDLSRPLDNPILDLQTDDTDPPSGIQESFTTSCEEALIYCRKIRDRFDALPKYLVERLAEANAIRAAEIRNKQAQAMKEETPVNDGITESLFSSKDPRVTETTKSSAPTPSVFSSAFASTSNWSTQSASKHVTMVEFGDNASEATFASFSTAASAISMGRPRIPPMPEWQEGGFDCTICYMRLAGVKTRKEWKRHVFNDLSPYVCTVEDCQNSRKLYVQSRTWANHESSHRSSRAILSECPFCSAAYQEPAPYYKHISGHLREVSLSVLPPPTDNDDGSDPDDTESSAISDASIPSIPLRKERDGTFPYTVWPHTGSDDSESDTESDTQIWPPSTGAAVLSDYDSQTAQDTSHHGRVKLIIKKLLEARTKKAGTMVDLHISDIQFLCTQVLDILLAQPMLLELEAPMKVVGDIHGDFHNLLRMFENSGFPEEVNYIFLGNYINIGKQSTEVICLLFAYKIKYPENFFLLRGNHEDHLVARKYGFFSECKQRYSMATWKIMIDVFNNLPLAAIIDEKMFCVHGGLSPDLDSLEQIGSITRPTTIPASGIICDLLWSDPGLNIVGWAENDRGAGFTFGPDVISRFLMKHNFDLIVRGHQVVENGYGFFVKKQLVTLWTVTSSQWGSPMSGAIMSVDESLRCSFQVFT